MADRERIQCICLRFRVCKNGNERAGERGIDVYIIQGVREG